MKPPNDYRRLMSLTTVWLAFWLTLHTTDALALSKPINLQLWHAMSGARLEASLKATAEGFSAANPGVTVKPRLTGSYVETLSKALAAYGAGHPPHIVQVHDGGTQTMLDSGAIMPVMDLIKPGVVDWGDYIAPLLNYYTVGEKLFAMPLNSSTAVLYYNKEAFERAGLDPSSPPDTFAEVEDRGRQLIHTGAARHAISFEWPAWIFEHMHAYHNIPFANHDNGRSKRATDVLFSGEFGVRLVERWKRWMDEGILAYGEGEDSPMKAFLAGEVVMLLHTSAEASTIERAAKFPVGTSFLPRIEGLPRGRAPIGGGSLWVFRGFPPEDYDAVVRFFRYLAQPRVAAQWHRETGYFPATHSAVKRLLNHGWFQENSYHLTALLQILSGIDTSATRGVLLGNLVQIRDIVDSAMEKVFGDILSPQAALDEAVREANRVLAEYAKQQ